MRTFTPSSLLTFINTGAPYNEAELWTFALQSGTVVRYTNHDVNVNKADVGGSGLFTRGGPIITRSMVKQKRGVEVSEMSFRLAATSTELLSNVPWLRALRAGALDYATVTLDIAVFGVGAPNTLLGYYNWFYGTVSRIPQIGLIDAEVFVKNAMSRLDVLMPRNVVQPNCLNIWGDAACGVNKETYSRTGTVTVVDPDGTLTVNIPGGLAAGVDYSGGRIIITNGDNANAVRKMKSYTAGVVKLFSPFVFTVAVGATIKIYPACSGTQAACTSFGNLANYRGIPYVPSPEVVL